ncbi:MAG: hypothetical protein KKG33_01980 [candidate division Zixibacteria bacterium]|nr:hypothetical protein [candidate division Zixibacteria bacterium]
MCKKLLVAVFVLSFLLALSSAAFAFKDPNHLKRLPNSLPDAPKASFERNVAFPEMPPQYSKPVSAAQPAVVNGTFTRAPADCETLSYWDGTPYWFWPIPDMYGDDFFNMRFTPAAGTATLDVVYLGFYDGGSSVISADGVDIVVWDDDGFGFPGTELGRINVAAVDMVWYPTALVVDFSALAIEVTDADFHVGFTTVNQTDDVYALLSDEGTTGSLRSSEFYTGMWGTMGNDWGLDVNFVIEADVCYGDIPIPECAWLFYGTYSAYYYWTIPDAYGDDFFNERFSNDEAVACTLKTAEINMYQGGSVDVTGEGIDLYVWNDDGGGYPGSVLQIVNIPTASITWYPGATLVDLTSYNIIIPANSDFHIGYTTVNQGAGNIMAVLSDDGSGPAEYRSSELWSGYWGLMIDDWGVDVDFMIAAEVCWEVAPAPDCYLLTYNGDAAYYWTIPDAYGDDYFNTRMTMPAMGCWLMDLNIAFYQGGSVGAPGADFIVFNSDGTYPTDTVAVYPVPVVTSWFPGYETVDVEADNIIIYGEFHLGYTPIYNDPGDVLAVLSDDGSSATGRGGEWWNGYWGLMVDDWGYDVCFLMDVNVCCPVVEPTEHFCIDAKADYDWPTLSHDYARTGDSQIEIGDLCGFQKIWEYWSPVDYCYFANPVMANGLVYAAFGVHLECFTVAGDGAGNPVPVWSTFTADPLYPQILGGSLRASPTIEDGFIYFGGGTFESFVKADAFTGAVVWHRSPILGTALEGAPGAMRFTPVVIIGDFVYFGGDGGTMYKLDKFTGVTSAWAATPYGNSVWVSPSSDGTDLYFGCSAGLTGGDAGAGAAVGGIYKYTPNLALHPGWPYGGFTGLLGWNEGSTNGASYAASVDQLFTQLGLADHTSFDHYNMIINAATGDPATANYWLCGQGFYANVALFEDAQLYYYGNVPYKDARFEGIWCRTYDNNTVWQDFTRGAMTNPAGLTCDANVFWGTRVPPYGTFNCSNADNGDPIFTYNLTGYGFGPAIAKYAGVPYVANTQLWSDCGSGGGRLTMYSMGADRPRLVAPGAITIEPPLEFIDPAGTERTVDDAFCNGGCVSLEYCLALEAHPSYPAAAYVTTVNPYSLTQADKNAAKVTEYTIDDFNAMDGWKAAKMQNKSVLRSEYGDRVMEAKQSDFSLSVPPSWVTLVSAPTGVLGPYACYDATFAFDTPNMGRGSNLFYLVVATDDPDYNECPSALPLCNGLEVNAMIEMEAIVGFAFCEFYLDFGFGGDDWQYTNNSGWFDDGNGGDNFIVDGMDDPLYLGTFWWGTRANRLAWLEEGGNGYDHLFADETCITAEEILLDEFCDGTEIYGDYFETAVIDSIFNYADGVLADSLTLGMRMVYREYGAFAESGTDYFNNFKLIAYDLSNRYANPVDDLYWGLYADWDMPGDAGGYEQVYGDIDASAIWQYNEVSGEVAGYGALPLDCSFLCPTGDPTGGMYNAVGLNNPDDVYPPAELPLTFMDKVIATGPDNVGYSPNAMPGSPPDDRSEIMTAGHHSFAGYETVQGAMVVFAYPGGATVGEITDMMKFANKWAGYGRGDVNDDGEIDLLDLVHLIGGTGGPCGPICPFEYLGDINCDDVVDAADAQYMYDWMFNGGPPPMSKLVR